jgi:hypothetical protein
VALGVGLGDNLQHAMFVSNFFVTGGADNVLYDTQKNDKINLTFLLKYYWLSVVVDFRNILVKVVKVLLTFVTFL